ncbi:MAG: serine/threonine protein kinase [Myxococcales bacterium]|nr:serine/threonine protein kinase [Myxococcales bacterium]
MHGAVRCCTSCGAIYRAAYSRCMNDGAEISEMTDDPMIGSSVGLYMIDELLGEGGMGRVYRAHHARLIHKRYALKILLGDLSSVPATRMRFAQEAESASRMSHPNVVAASDFGVTSTGLAYLVMDLVEGKVMSALLRDQAMAPERVIHLARQLCAGLGHAHDLGLIHRDFKPDNVIVIATDEGEVPRIADFGLAISKDPSDARWTGTGMVLGTPGYIAPEQCTKREVDARADLYALGVTMFEMLSGGRLPFEGDPSEMVGLKLSCVAPTIASRAPHVSVPPALCAIVARLLQRRAVDRYPDARAVIDALDAAARSPHALAIGSADCDLSSRSAQLPRGTTAHIPRSSVLRAVGLGLALGALVAAAVAIDGANETPEPAVAPVLVAAASELPLVPEPTPEPRREAPPPPVRASKSGHKGRTPKSPRVTIERPTAPEIRAVATMPAPAPVVELSVPRPPPPPPRPVGVARIVELAVQGPLANAEVRRAVDRALPAVRACRSDAPGVITVTFTIGESGQATGLRASGLSPAVARCVSSALSTVRTATAPDVGEVTVVMRVGYERPG